MSFFDRQGIPEALLRNRTEPGNVQQDQRQRSGNNNTDDGEDSESQSSISDEFEDDVLTLRKFLGTVVGAAVLLGVGSVLYLIVAENQGLGRLMRDSLVHSLTIGGINGPGIPNACMAGLQTVIDVVGKEKLV